MANKGKTTIWLTPEVAEKIVAVYRLAHPKEVLMLLFADIDEETKEIIVNDTYLPYQLTSAGGCEITQDGLVKMPDELGLEKYTTVRGIWHSHQNMGAYYSGIDTSFLRSIKTKNIPYFISIVTGKGGKETKGRVEIMEPFNAQFEADVKIIGAEDYLEKYRADFDERVEIKVPAKVIVPKTKTKGKDIHPLVYTGVLGDPIQDYVLDPIEVDYRRFSLANPILADNGDPLCCGQRMALIGQLRDGREDVLYCRMCYNTINLPKDWKPSPGKELSV